MKIYIVTFLLTIAFQFGFSQYCIPPSNLNANVSGQDVSLHWNTPIGNGLFSINEVKREVVNTINDASPTSRRISNYNVSRDYLDLQFSFPVSDDVGQAGIESDGSYIYTSIWSNNYFVKYEFDGTVVDTFSIANVSEVRDLAFCEVDGYVYGASPSNTKIYIMDFNNRTLVDVLNVANARAIAYNNDLDIFYINNWGTDVKVIDRQTGNTLDTIPLTGAYASYYGFAYDNWSDGGPYLWGFSQDGSGSDIVQLNLPDITETGLVIDMVQLTGLDGIAGGLFTQPDIIEGKVTLGGLMQNELIFGIDLGDVAPPSPIAIFSGYNIFRDGAQLNVDPYTDTTYLDLGLELGTYSYEVTAIYEDTLGAFLCESDPTEPILITIEEAILLGGNVFVGSNKLDLGKAHAFKYDNLIVQDEYSVNIDELGYYFFYPFIIGEYYVRIDALINSSHYNDYIPTYHGNVYHWENSQIISLQANLYNADINLIPIAYSGMGNGKISGYVFFEDIEMNSQPANNIQFLLLDDNDYCISFVYSNELGYFSFPQLANGTYKILCEVIGKKMTPLIFVIDDDNQHINDLEFYISGDEIIMGIDDNLPNNIGFLSNVFPNPAINKAKVYLESDEHTRLEASIINYLGQKIKIENIVCNQGRNLFEFDISSLIPGVYQLVIMDEHNAIATRKFIKMR